MSVAIVPLDQMNNITAQKRFSIYHGCWDQHTFRCKQPSEDDVATCGTDKRGFAYERMIRIPLVVPDGIYAFTYEWNGGISVDRKFGAFPDHHSYAFIRIRGGLTDTENVGYQPFFNANNKRKWAVRGKCHTSTVNPGDCPTDGCFGPKWPTMITVPGPFQNGNVPRKLFTSDFTGDNVNRQPGSTIMKTSTPTPTASITPIIAVSYTHLTLPTILLV